MRLQPPKNWPHEEMNFEQFKDYVLNHRVLGLEKEITFLEFYNNTKDNYKDKLDFAVKISTIFPLEYKYEIFMVINELD